ncbi:MAG: GNAT family N-acetyltransferase [Patescibacteria group bacterium]
MITIRKANIGDLKPIQNLSYKLFRNDEGRISNLVMDWSQGPEGEKYFTDRIENRGVCFVAEDDGEVVGYITGEVKKDISWRSVHISELENIFIEEKYRHQSIGRRLFEELKNWSKENGAQKMTVSPSIPNTSAIEFYKSVGFEPYSLELEMEIE